MILRQMLAACALWTLLAAGAAAAPRNVVLFVTDDMSPTAGCYGDPVIQTPNLDQLAEEGTRYTNAFCTTASCSASRSVILSGLFNHATGQYGHEHHFHHFRSYDSLQTLPVLLAKAGYRTASAGKFHVGPKSVYPFDEFLPGGSRSPVQMAEKCQSFIAKDREEPFFLYFCTSDPHRDGSSIGPLNANSFGNSREYPGIEEVEYDPQDVTVPPFLPDTEICRAELAEYYQSVSRIDQGLGRLIEILKEAGQYDDTLIIFTSDHGIAFPGGKTTLYEGGMLVPMVARSPDQQQRGVVCDALISLVDLTPTILDYAGGLQADKQTVSPELAEALVREGHIQRQSESLNRFHGRSFLATLDQEHPEGFDEVFASHTFHEIQMYYPMRVVRNREYKLIWNIAYPLPFPFASDLWIAPTWQDRYRKGPDTYYGKRTVHDYIHRPEFELYDIANDPNETTNLAEDPQHAQTLEALKQKIKKFQHRTFDGWVTKWKYE